MSSCCRSHSRGCAMAPAVLCAVLGLVLGIAAAFGPVPRTTWEQQEIHLKHFQESTVFNYSTLLLSEETNILYIGAREAIFAVNSLDVSEKQNEVKWAVSEDTKKECSRKGKSIQTDCLNYVRVLQPLNSSVLYVCGTNAFQPTCNYLSVSPFQMVGKSEDGKGRCPFDPAHSYTSVMVDGELYSGTSYTFLGSEPIILRHSQHGQLRTEYAVPWLNEPRFVFSDVIRESPSRGGDDDKVYFFFTEVSVEYEFVNKLLIPRIARVCKNDHGGLRTLQKKWTSFLKAKLICSVPEKNLVFNVVNDVFILKPPRPAEPVIYGVFTYQLNNVVLSAVCAYNISTVEDVFAKGKYMHSTTVEQSHTKWVQYNGDIPSPRPGACITSQAKALNYNTSLDLPDKTLQFVKDHPLMNDLVMPIGNRPKLMKQNVKYTQIVVDRVKALDHNVYDVMFISTDKGTLQKALSYANEMYIIEEIELFPNSEPIQTLILSSKKDKKFIYAGSNVGVVQSPVAFCEKYGSCVDCVLSRDPYCAWQQDKDSCVHIPQSGSIDSSLIQKLNGNASTCLNKSKERELLHILNLGSSVKLTCSQKSNLATVFWMFERDRVTAEGPKYYRLGEALFVFNVTVEDMGVYQCLSEEDVLNIKYYQVLAQHVLELRKVPPTTTTVGPTHVATQTEASSLKPFPSTGTFPLSSVESNSHPLLTNMQPEVLSSVENEPVTLLPPFLSDQAQVVVLHGTFHLFCQATGPKDAHFIWEKNGEKMESCVTDQSFTLVGGKKHIFSWMKDIATEKAGYRCSVASKSGNQTAKVMISVAETVPEEWPKNFANWKTAVSDHSYMMQSWKKTMESCKNEDLLQKAPDLGKR
ncbi:semaphorin-4D isoform X2 [Ambystoma mexicanum]|uniref:semaphorin-4D isoform X2 n=1 Tax=Ambystoma mexicanum TaxID=8296 RepID=UPI0037E908C7